MRYIVLAGRIIFSYLFITAGFNHLLGAGVDMAAQSGVPFASLTVPLGGLLALLGGLSLALGYKTKWGAWLVVVFLLPVTFTMHQFWVAQDPMTAMIQQAMFVKNFAMMGAAFLISYFGAGPLSLDAWIKSGHRWPRIFNKEVNV